MVLNSNEVALLELWNKEADQSEAAKESMKIISGYLNSRGSSQVQQPDLHLVRSGTTA
jgi:hypothetical protein